MQNVIWAVLIVFLGIAALAFLWLVYRKRFRRNEQRTALLLNLTRSISSTIHKDELLDTIAHTIVEGLLVKGVVIRIPDETTGILKIRAAFGLSHEFCQENPIELDKEELAKESLARGPVRIDDTKSDERIQHRELILAEGVRSILIAPMMNRDDPLGVLSVYAAKPNHFSSEDIDFIVDVTRLGASIMERVSTCEECKSLEETQMQFMYYTTHELRSPVNSAQSLLRVLQTDYVGELNEQQLEIISRVERRLDLLTILIDDMLELAASCSIDLNKPLERVPLLPTLEKIIDCYQQEAAAKQIDVAYSGVNSPICVQATEDGLEKVFSNLIGNAIKYTPTGGDVEIQVEKKPGRAVIQISDTGIGIPPEDIPHIWDEFFRAKNARILNIQGTGLGLCIVKKFVDHFGGWIDVRSIEGEGTTFTFSVILCSAEKDRGECLPVGE
ncbi:MAG: GAF domain-containing sensor histidine kinase [Anaerolineales bacterium]